MFKKTAVFFVNKPRRQKRMRIGESNMRRTPVLYSFIAMTVCLLFILAGCGEEPFRLHIIANSDTEEDQGVKLKVRDDILHLMEDGMEKVDGKEEAEEYIRENIQIIEKTADETLKANDMDYSAKAYIGRYEFPERTYGDKTYPAGQYDALRIVLGEGQGHNWWCVLYPPLCLMEVKDAELNDLKETDKIEYKSFIGEWFQKVFGGS